MSAWLVKSEESCYSIDDLKRDRKTHWDGVRNYQARNFLQEMKRGDPVLYYHSSCDVPGIIGLATVACVAYPDPTQFDPKSEYYDEKATEAKPRWFCPDLSFKQRFSRVISLDDLREQKALRSMQVLQRGNRLSVMKVLPEEYSVIHKMANSM